MKANNDKTVLCAAMVAMLLAPQLGFAQDFGSDQDILNSQQIDIDGSFQRKETQADRLAKMRKKLEQRNEQMVQKKIEDIRVSHEKELSGKLNNAFSGGINQLDQDYVGTTQAAPQKVVAPVEALEVKGRTFKNKIVPFFGFTQYNGEDIELEANPSIGVTFENNIADNIAIGAGIKYSTMDIIYRTIYNNNNFYQYDLDGDEVKLRNLNINLSGKFYIGSSRIKPFVGGELGYNRSSVKFGERQNSFYQNDTTTKVSGNSVNVAGLFGAELDFTDNFGMTASFRYSRNLSNGFDSRSHINRFGGYTQEDQDKDALRSLGNRISDADEAGINLGLVVRF